MDLQDIRARIDAVDHRLVEALDERFELVEEVAAAKREQGGAIRDRAREQAIIRRVTAGETPQRAEALGYLFTTLFALSRAQEARLLEAQESPLRARLEALRTSAPFRLPREATVAVQGVEGAYGQAAAERFIAHPQPLYFNSFDAVFSAVAQGLCTFGVLPLENSSYGSVDEVYDLMKRHEFSIVATHKLRIHHVLLAEPGANLAGIRTIYSHEQAIGQCGAFLKKLPQVRVVAVENTALAAQAVAAANDPQIAAIASRDCADLYGLSVIADDIQITDNNYTRFILISRDPLLCAGSDRISLMVELPHEPGSLASVLMRFAAQDINLVKLESRPIPGSDFEFRFYLDLEGALADDRTVETIAELEKLADDLVFLGAYREV